MTLHCNSQFITSWLLATIIFLVMHCEEIHLVMRNFSHEGPLSLIHTPFTAEYKEDISWPCLTNTIQQSWQRFWCAGGIHNDSKVLMLVNDLTPSRNNLCGPNAIYYGLQALVYDAWVTNHTAMLTFSDDTASNRKAAFKSRRILLNWLHVVLSLIYSTLYGAGSTRSDHSTGQQDISYHLVALKV